MADIIREDIVSIRFEVEDSPFAKIQATMQGLMGQVQEFAKGGQSGFGALRQMAPALAPLRGLPGILNAANGAFGAMDTAGRALGFEKALADAKTLAETMAAAGRGPADGLTGLGQLLSALPAAGGAAFAALAQNLRVVRGGAGEAGEALSQMENRGQSAAGGLAAALETATKAFAGFEKAAARPPAQNLENGLNAAFQGIYQSFAKSAGGKGGGGFTLPPPKADTAGAAAAGGKTWAAYAGSFKNAAAAVRFELPSLNTAQLNAGLLVANPALQNFAKNAQSAAASGNALGGGLGKAALAMQNIRLGLNTLGPGFSAWALSAGQSAQNTALALTALQLKTAQTQTAMLGHMGAITVGSQLMAGQMTATFNALGASFYGAGVNAMLGFQNGLNAQRGAALATAQSIANAVANTMASALKIHSPSRVTAQLGAFTGQGFAQGLYGSLPAVQAGAQNLANRAAAPLLYPRAPQQNPPLQTGGARHYVTQNNSPQFSLTIGGAATQSDREMERRVKGWILDSFNRLMQNAKPSAQSAREV